VVRAAEAGASPELLGRYLEAWLLRLHGLYPPLDRCAACGTALSASPLRYHRPAHGFVCDGCLPASGPVLSLEARALLARFFKEAPDTLADGPLGAARELEAFHRGLIGAHLERDLRAPRVIREITREGAR
jgi:recombinational DNA repair protein (RecF pathway)